MTSELTGPFNLIASQKIGIGPTSGATDLTLSAAPTGPAQTGPALGGFNQ